MIESCIYRVLPAACAISIALITKSSPAPPVQPKIRHMPSVAFEATPSKFLNYTT